MGTAERHDSEPEWTSWDAIPARTSALPANDSTPSGEFSSIGVRVGPYVVYSQIAAGGMASVHIGRMTGQAGFARTVAIKRLHPQYARNPEFVAMIVDEARIAGRIRHPNVVSVLDVVARSGELFLVMEYIRGESFSRLLRAYREKGEVIPHSISASIVAHVLHGLHAAHDARNEYGAPLGLVHRDVSPQNILVGADGAARLLDFGVAKAANRVQATRSGQIKGKLDYMSREQVSGGIVTRQADIYAASVVLWEALTGRRLLEDETLGNKLKRILSGDVPRAAEINPSVPGELDAVVMRGLAADTRERYPTAKEMALDLEKALPGASPAVVGELVEKTALQAIRRRDDLVTTVESVARSDVRLSTLEEIQEELGHTSRVTPNMHESGVRRTAPDDDVASDIPVLLELDGELDDGGSDGTQDQARDLVPTNQESSRPSVYLPKVAIRRGRALLIGAAAIVTAMVAAAALGLSERSEPPAASEQRTGERKACRVVLSEVVVSRLQERAGKRRVRAPKGAPAAERAIYTPTNI